MVDVSELGVTTTAGERFSGEDSAAMALLIWRRWGRDDEAAAVAWRRLMQNSCPDHQFMRLVRFAQAQQTES